MSNFSSSVNSMNARLRQLVQLTNGPVRDQHLHSTLERDELVKCDYAEKINGWNIITANGVIVADNLNLWE